jgi:hypothetical protein
MNEQRIVRALVKAATLLVGLMLIRKALEDDDDDADAPES